MAATLSQIPVRDEQTDSAFLDYLPAVTTRASVQFRHRPDVEREEAIAEAAAAALMYRWINPR
ncbi:MAG: hypothetical protein ACYSVY_20945 [Planctomycetota bacterium]|jgi:hypothetical protein